MKNLIGNNNAAEILSRLVTTGRVPNALLFAGPEGVGKKQFAIELARSFVCTHLKGGLACGQCPPCHRAGEFAIPKFENGKESDRVFFGQHPDVGMVVPYNRNLRIDAIRALEREANFRPFEANARVFIIDDAEKMNDASSNALLKTLEEPPATSHIILIASRADCLLPTIRSRCQIIRFAPVPALEIERHLTDIGLFDATDAALAAHASGGSVGRALEFVPASFRDQRSAMLDVLRAAVAGDRRELLRCSEEMNDARAKDEFEEKLAILENLIHDVWVLRNGSSETIFNPDILADLKQLSDRIPSGDLSGWLSRIELLGESLAVNVNRKVSTDALFVGMSA
ncbi:MAG TPA: DNA polymerase III subunit delta' C-terminal domain-containing protein [Pyrinomonadaceae bacterium]|nr:DNA polymerase III subunit delta' C-terminal domain-containing protein [Pyrinomonadaceae bacterium]